MSVLAAVGAFNIGTDAAGSTVQVSGLWPDAEVPKAVLFWWSGRTGSVNAFGSGSHDRGHGWAVGASDFRAVCARDFDGGANADTDSGHRADACIAVLASDGTFGAAAGWADVQSVGDGSFLLEILQTFGKDLRVSYLAIGGSEIAAATGTHTSAGSGTVNVAHGLGVAPKACFFMGCAAADAPSVKADSSYSFGASAGPPSPIEAVWSGGSQDGGGSGGTSTYCRMFEMFALNQTNPNNVPNDRCTHDGSDSTNMVLNWLARANAVRLHWLAISGGTWAIGSLTTQTDTTTAFATGALGFFPRAALFVSAGKAETASGGTPAAHDEWSVGAASSDSNRTCQQASSRDGNTVMFVQIGLRTDAIYLNADPTADAIEGLADVQTWDDPITLIMDDADPAQAFMWYVAVGTAKRRFMLH